MKYDIARYHVETIRNGQFDPHKNNEKLSVVLWDSKSYYYDLSEIDVSAEDFSFFVIDAFSGDNEQYNITAHDVQWDGNVFRANID